MVHGQVEDVVLLIQARQLGPDQGALGEVEGGGRLRLADLGQPGLRVRRARQVVLKERHAERRIQELHLGLAVPLAEHRAQGLVAGIKPVQAPPKDLDLQRTSKAQRQRHVVGRTGPLQLVQEPQPLLGEGQRQHAIARELDHRRQPLRSAL